MKTLKEKAEKYFGVDIDQIQRNYDLTHSYDSRNFTKEIINKHKKNCNY